MVAAAIVDLVTEPDEVDRNDLDNLDAMLGARGIDIREVLSMITATLGLVDAHRPYVAPAKCHEAAIDHGWSQEILDHALADPAATERHQELIEQRRAERAAQRDFRALRRSNEMKIEMAVFPPFSLNI